MLPVVESFGKTAFLQFSRFMAVFPPKAAPTASLQPCVFFQQVDHHEVQETKGLALYFGASIVVCSSFLGVDLS